MRVTGGGARGPHGTALHYACTKANVANARALINAGADGELADADGRTPRRVAEDAGRAKILAALDA